MHFSIIVYPGTNCDHDCQHVLSDVFNQETQFVWYQEKDLPKTDCIVLPGGFSYGDYLRTGAIARFSPIMEKIMKFAEDGGMVLGICNGFQILLEAGMLPGAMLRNSHLRFVCKDVQLRTENAETLFTNELENGQVITLPIAHNEGNYFASKEVLKELEKNKQIVFRYCSPTGEITEKANPNGSLSNIAGIVNRKGNVFGLMPHPERCAEKVLGNQDGRYIFESMINYLNHN